MKLTDLKATHDADQRSAEAIELGDARLVGSNEQGEDTMELTAKGVTRIAIIMTERFVSAADAEKRDFTQAEKHEIIGHLFYALVALKQADTKGVTFVVM